MKDRAALLSLVTAVADDLKSDPFSDDIRFLGESLAAAPQRFVQIVTVFFEEMGRKKPSEDHFSGFQFVLTRTLDALRIGVENGKTGMQAAINSIEAAIVAAIDAGQATPIAVMLMGQFFAEAKLRFSPATAARVSALLEASGPDHGKLPTASAMDNMLAHLATEIGGDPFEGHASIDSKIAAFSVEQRAVIVGGLARASFETVREASLGWLLDARPEIALEVAAALEGSARAGALSATVLSRLTLLRNLVAEPVREPLDRAIRAGRQKIHGEAAAASRPRVESVLISGLDGAGAQTLIAAVKAGRSLSFVSVLLKLDVGVRDTMVGAGVTKAEFRAMRQMFEGEVELFESTASTFAGCLAEGLAQNVASGVTPPFQIVQVIEMMGLGVTAPRPTTLDERIASLLGDADQAGQARVAAAMHAAPAWFERYLGCESWFEDDEAIFARLKSTRHTSKKADLLLDELMPGTRARWAEILSRTAVVIAGQKGRHAAFAKQDAIDMALVAREMASRTPLRDIPFAVQIAKKSVEIAGMARRPLNR